MMETILSCTCSIAGILYAFGVVHFERRTALQVRCGLKAYDIYILPVLVDCLMIEVRLLDMQDEWLLLEHLLYLVT